MARGEVLSMCLWCASKLGGAGAQRLHVEKEKEDGLGCSKDEVVRASLWGVPPRGLLHQMCPSLRHGGLSRYILFPSARC